MKKLPFLIGLLAAIPWAYVLQSDNFFASTALIMAQLFGAALMFFSVAPDGHDQPPYYEETGP